MTDALGNFFSGMSEENQKKVQESMNNAKGDRKDVLPGKYVMEVVSFAWKKNNEMNKVPDFVVTRKNALQLKLVLAVADDGTEVVPKGSTIFHNITISPAQGSDQSKIDTIMKFTTPILKALTGETKINFTKKWLDEYCGVIYEEQEDGKYKLIKDHKMKNKVFASVNEDTLPSGQVVARIKFINPLRPGDKSETFSNDPEAGLTLDKPATQQDQDATSFNFGLNDKSKDPKPEGTSSTVAGIGGDTQVSQEDY